MAGYPSPSGRPRTSDVFGPNCDNYEQFLFGELRRPRRTPASPPARSKRKQQTDFCNHVLWSILEYLERVAHRLVDGSHRRVYSFGCDDYVLEADDKFTCWASLNDPTMFTADFVRHLAAELFPTTNSARTMCDSIPNSMMRSQPSGRMVSRLMRAWSPNGISIERSGIGKAACSSIRSGAIAARTE